MQLCLVCSNVDGAVTGDLGHHDLGHHDLGHHDLGLDSDCTQLGTYRCVQAAKRISPALALRYLRGTND